ncbi:hypothetical protein SpCBS45565_g03352 [Spizellomyces sp. 'palustris']|nr:hypothetical protein SpCBS45565_g03352 [Spizellomyces sp. 'palustris']
MTQCWQPGTEYGNGSVVEYQGSHYRVIQPHRSQGDWTPDRTPALWGRVADNECGQQQQHHHHQQQQQGGYQQPQQQAYQQQPPQQQPPQQQQGYGYGQQNQQGYGSIPAVVPENSNDPRKQQKEGFNIGGFHISDDQMKIGGGILGTAAAVGIGAFAWDKYNDAKEDKAETAWGSSNWEQDARRRQGEYLEAIKNNRPLPPVTWILTDGNNIPQGAIRGGQESDGTPLYIARAYYDKGVHIGKISKDMKDGARIAYGGKEVTVPKYEILLGYENAVKWVDGEGHLKNVQGLKLVEGGRESDGRPLYIAQAHIKNSVQPAKVAEHLDGAFVPYGGDEKKEKHYRYLVYA